MLPDTDAKGKSQHSNKEKFFLALEHCKVVSWYGHGSTANNGSIWLGDNDQLLTGSELQQTYQQWIYWGGPGKKRLVRTDLSHIKLVMLLGCWTGGRLSSNPEDTPDDTAANPDPSSVAGALRALNVEAVIFTIGGPGGDSLLLP